MRTPYLFFEQIYLREKERNQFAKARKAELSDEKIREEVAAIEKSNAEILSEYSADRMREAVMKKMETRKPAVNRTLVFRTIVAASAAAACLAFALFVAIPRGDGAGQAIKSGTTGSSGLIAGAERAKGDGPRLFVYRKDGNKAIELETGSHVREGDVLQLSYIASGAAYGAILSVDGNGTVSFHYPDSGPVSARLIATGEVPLDFAYKLDDAPDFERFFFITGAKPFTTASFAENIRIRAKVGDLKTADLSKIVPLGTRLTELTVLK